jgi:hypothetical protein
MLNFSPRLPANAKLTTEARRWLTYAIGIGICHLITVHPNPIQTRALERSLLATGLFASAAIVAQAKATAHSILLQNFRGNCGDQKTDRQV